MKTKNLKMREITISKVFLLDAIGACLTALLLSQLLARLVSIFGMPGEVLFPLAGIATVFALYSFTMFFCKGRGHSLEDNFTGQRGLLHTDLYTGTLLLYRAHRLGNLILCGGNNHCFQPELLGVEGCKNGE